MTLEEAKKRIANCFKQSTDDYNFYGDEVSRGEADAYKHALKILACVNDPVGNPDKMTLKELALELRKILPRTRYVTVGDNPKASIVGDKIVSIFYERDGRKPKPEYNKDSMRPNTWGMKHPKLEVYGKPFYAPGFYQFYVKEVVDLDLSEYKNADGSIDYSKCIVEVE